MKYIFKLFAIFSLSILFKSHVVGNGITANLTGPVEPSTLHFELVEGLILVTATLEGVDGSYIFDTGASHLTLNKRVDRGDFELLTVDNQFQGSEIHINHFQFSNVLMKNQYAWQMDLSFVEDLIDRPIAGIFGNELLKDYNVFIDFESSEIELSNIYEESFNIDLGQYNFTTVKIINRIDHMPIVEAIVDGQKLNFIFDTGAAISVIDGPINSKSRLSERMVDLNHIHIQNVQFATKDLSALIQKNVFDIQGILSVSALNTSKIIIDNRNSRIHLLWAKA